MKLPPATRCIIESDNGIPFPCFVAVCDGRTAGGSGVAVWRVDVIVAVGGGSVAEGEGGMGLASVGAQPVPRMSSMKISAVLLNIMGIY